MNGTGAVGDGADASGDAIVDSANELPRAGRRRVVHAVAAVAVAAVVALVAGRLLTPMTVRVTPVVRGAAVDAVYASGTVEAVDRVDVKARVAGVVAALPVKE
ncbi:MAG TPA: hypothetical protein VIA18_11870, partial [Polyangia bacterium]|nr:hypothetical protein [Polyangia bacterium]